MIIPKEVSYVDSNVFRNCKKLASVTIPDSINHIYDGAFADCTSLTTITIPDSVNYIDDGAFSGCTSLSSVKIPASVWSIGGASFAGVKGIVVDGGNENYKVIDGVLMSADGTRLIQCATSLKGAYTIPTGVTTIGKGAFDYCTGITSVTIPASVESIEDGAFGIHNIQTFIVEEGNKDYRVEGGVLLGKRTYYIDEEQFVADVIVTTAASIKGVYVVSENVWGIAASAFAGRTSLTSVKLSEKMMRIGTKAFKGTGLTELTIPASVKYIEEGAFLDCANLKCVVFNGEPPKVDEIDGSMTLGGAEDGYWFYFSGWEDKWEEAISNHRGLDKYDSDTHKDWYGHWMELYPFEMDEMESYYDVGQQIDDIGIYLIDTYTVEVSGLPKGLTAEDDLGMILISGAPTTEGYSTITITATRPGYPTVMKEIGVNVGMMQLELAATTNSIGMVKSLTGAGCHASGKPTLIKAEAKAGYVFAGWYWDEEGTSPCEFETSDYREPSVNFMMPTTNEWSPDEPVFLYAKFVSAEEDTEILSTGLDGSEFTVGEEWEYSIFTESISIPTVSMTGLPKGLSYDPKTSVISGTPMAPGVYTVTVVLSNASTKNRVEEFTITVPNLDSDLIYLSWDGNTNKTLITGVKLSENELPVAVEEGWILGVTGLPAGLTYDSKTGQIVGAPTKTGIYTITFTATKKNEVPRVSTRTMVIESRTVNLFVIGEKDGVKALSGDGEYVVGAKVPLKAEANKGYVFAGWYSDEYNSVPYVFGAADYRTANISYAMPNTNVLLYARFVRAEEDDYLTTGLDWVEETAEEGWEYQFYVDSLSAPTLKMTGLPKGLAVVNTKNNMVMIRGTCTEPGLYDVMFTLSSASIKEITETFKIRVPNLDSNFIHPMWGGAVHGSMIWATIMQRQAWSLTKENLRLMRMMVGC